MLAHKALEVHHVTHALIGGFQTDWTNTMTMDEYFDFLDEYWEIFGPPPEAVPKKVYSLILI
jgi:hypothetical protein